VQLVVQGELIVVVLVPLIPVVLCLSEQEHVAQMLVTLTQMMCVVIQELVSLEQNVVDQIVVLMGPRVLMILLVFAVVCLVEQLRVVLELIVVAISPPIHVVL